MSRMRRGFAIRTFFIRATQKYFEQQKNLQLRPVFQNMQPGGTWETISSEQTLRLTKRINAIAMETGPDHAVYSLISFLKNAILQHFGVTELGEISPINTCALESFCDAVRIENLLVKNAKNS